MTINKIVTMFKEEKPNKVSDGHIIQWLNECEAEVQYAVKIPAEEWVQYTEDDLSNESDVEPVATPPFDRLYLYFLMARLDFANQEFEAYMNHRTQYESLFKDFVSHSYREGLVVNTLPKSFKNVF